MTVTVTVTGAKTMRGTRISPGIGTRGIGSSGLDTHTPTPCSCPNHQVNAVAAVAAAAAAAAITAHGVVIFDTAVVIVAPCAV
jgi:hypothetical protein